MIPDGYRIFVSFHPDKEKFVARVPELNDIRAEADTRAEALGKAEEEIEASIRKAAEGGDQLPQPVDGTEYSGELSLQVTPSLHRELAYLATQEGVELNQLAAEGLNALEHSPSTITDVLRRISKDREAEPSPDLLEHLKKLFADFDEFGLIERASC